MLNFWFLDFEIFSNFFVKTRSKHRELTCSDLNGTLSSHEIHKTHGDCGFWPSWQNP